MTTFTPWLSLAGGAMIGLSAVLFMAFHGRILGVTGIVRGAIIPAGFADWSIRVAILLGMVTGPLVYLALFRDWPVVEIPVTRTMVIVGGLLVGLGVGFGGGCTSGHGVCGIARLSPRSLVATVTFMATAFATVFVVRHVIGGIA
ncbi:YeeE/YedE family protein [Acuticoccus sp. M5D2P5]|uniref:YeeE/YedE family protein n=1 Tax=Acuticoccus kalidii TaxID=2910977 RepID=UPI001F1D0B98|nr:YeeE/YedE thiosulfate transporter family protein [Acuticoccus kalidii]MCF3934519.1 YeeE/YedE family protein [Acuticoccus kalidii]